MGNDHTVIVVAGYQDLAAARDDFAELRFEVEQERFDLRAAMLVTRDPDGLPRVIDTGNHTGEASAGTSIGVLAGLFAPPLRFTPTADSGIGTLVGRFADLGFKSGLHDDIGQALAAGTGVVIAVIPPASQVQVERTLRGCPRTTTVTLAESTINSLEATVAEEMNEVAAVEAAVESAAAPGV